MTVSRWYFPLTTAADVSPAFAAWNETSAALRRKTSMAKGTSAITVGSAIGTTQTLGNKQSLDRQYVSDPIAAQTLSPSGAPWTVTGQILVSESALNDNLDRVSVAIRVFSNDGSTVRGTLVALNSYATANEFAAVTYQNRFIAIGGSMTEVVAQDGDRIVIEIGNRIATPGGGTTVSGTAKWGENATDLPIDELTVTDGAPWVEFSGEVILLQPGAGTVATPIGSASGTSTVTGTGSGTVATPIGSGSGVGGVAVSSGGAAGAAGAPLNWVNNVGLGSCLEVPPGYSI